MLRGCVRQRALSRLDVLRVSIDCLVRHHIRGRIEAGIRIIVTEVTRRQTAVAEINDIAARARDTRSIEDRPIWRRIRIQVGIGTALCRTPLTAFPGVNSSNLVVTQQVSFHPTGALAEERHVVNRGKSEAMPMIKQRVGPLRRQVQEVLGTTRSDDGGEEISRTVVNHVAESIGSLELQAVGEPAVQLRLQSVISGCSQGQEAVMGESNPLLRNWGRKKPPLP